MHFEQGDMTARLYVNGQPDPDCAPVYAVKASIAINPQFDDIKIRIEPKLVFVASKTGTAEIRFFTPAGELAGILPLVNERVSDVGEVVVYEDD